jgi:hypothetical protein
MRYVRNEQSILCEALIGMPSKCKCLRWLEVFSSCRSSGPYLGFSSVFFGFWFMSWPRVIQMSLDMPDDGSSLMRWARICRKWPAWTFSESGQEWSWQTAALPYRPRHYLNFFRWHTFAIILLFRPLQALRSLPNFPNEYNKVLRYCPTYFGFSGDCTGRISHGLLISAFVPMRCSDNCFPMRDLAEIWANASDHDIKNFSSWWKKSPPELSS